MPDLLLLTLAAAGTALATGLGALPVRSADVSSRVPEGALWGLTAGVMAATAVVGLLRGFVAGVASIAAWLLGGWAALRGGGPLARVLAGADPVLPPTTTMLGALYRYLRDADPRHFQPMNANFGLLDDLDQRVRDKRRKRELLAERALEAIGAWRDGAGLGAGALAGA